MPLGRPVGLLVVLAVVVVTALLLESLRPTEPSRPPLLGIRADDVVGIRVRKATGELRAVRRGGLWRIETPAPARPDGPVAIAEMVDFLAALVPVDTFARQQLERRDFGMDPARARIEIEVRDQAEPVVLLLGDYVPTGGSVYGALASDQRIHQIGALIWSEIEKAFYLVFPVKEPEGVE